MDFYKTLFFVLLITASGLIGYNIGQNDKELENALDKVSAVTRTLEAERQKQDALISANRSLSSDVDKLNRMLKSKASQPANLTACIKERDRLRSLVQDAGVLVVECRKGLDWCDIQYR